LLVMSLTGLDPKRTLLRQSLPTPTGTVCESMVRSVLCRKTLDLTLKICREIETGSRIQPAGQRSQMTNLSRSALLAANCEQCDCEHRSPVEFLLVIKQRPLFVLVELSE